MLKQNTAEMTAEIIKILLQTGGIERTGDIPVLIGDIGMSLIGIQHAEMDRNPGKLFLRPAPETIDTRPRIESRTPRRALQSAAALSLPSPEAVAESAPDAPRPVRSYVRRAVPARDVGEPAPGPGGDGLARDAERVARNERKTAGKAASTSSAGTVATARGKARAAKPSDVRQDELPMVPEARTRSSENDPKPSWIARHPDGSIVTAMEEGKAPAVPLRDSLTDDYVICLEDGKKAKMLKRWIRARYGMSPKDYRTRWGLPAVYPLVASSYSGEKRDYASRVSFGRQGRKSEEARTASEEVSSDREPTWTPEDVGSEEAAAARVPDHAEA